jgi:hypothetical protein
MELFWMYYLGVLHKNSEYHFRQILILKYLVPKIEAFDVIYKYQPI